MQHEKGPKMPSKYVYSPIRTPGDIRVLDLRPGKFEDPIHCRIRHTSLEQQKYNFIAISYSWGNNPARKDIYCNDNDDQLEIYLDCYNMLRWLRREGTTRTLWIDAICINQKDPEEKSLQVRAMGEIYAAAISTDIYLGEHTPGSEALFCYLDDAQDILLNGGSTDLLPAPPDTIVDEVERLFERTWFSRIWVIQELRNSRFPKFVCGRDAVYAPAMVECHCGFKRKMPIPVFSPAPIKLFFDSLTEDLEKCKTPAQKMYFLATGTGVSKATNPRDRIFALAPLIENQPEELRNLIDYTLAADEVFRRFALFCIETVGLALLRMVQHPRPGDLPSWVPDWAQTRQLSPYDSQIPDFFKYTESRDAYKCFSIKSDNKDQLIVRGRRFGYIEEQGPLLHSGEGDSESRIEAASHLVRTLQSIKNGDRVLGWPDSIMRGESNTRSTLFHNSNMPSYPTY